MKRTRRIEFTLGLACLALAGAITFSAWRSRCPEPQRASLLERLVGPFAGLAASAQWVRADVALREGRFGVFCERAETALALAPSDPQGWIYFAHVLIFDRASLEREPVRERRESWVRAGVELLLRAERECAQPAEICFDEGLVLAYLAEIPDEERPWSENPRELRQHAIEAFARANALGQRRAVVLEQALRDRLLQTDR